MKKIMIVDDATLMRTMIKNIINEIGDVTIIEARNGYESVRLFKATNPDLVTMDITMDVQNGVDAAKEILHYDKTAKIIMVTALGQEPLLRDCIRAGVKDFIVKPFTRERLIAAINNILNEDDE